MCVSSCMNARKKQKFKIHTGSVSEMALFMVNFQDKAKKKFSKVCLVGTLNLCLKEPEKMQKTRNQSDYPRQRKCPKNVKSLHNSYYAVFGQFLEVFSDYPLVFFILSGSLRHKFRVPTRHTFKKFFFLAL